MGKISEAELKELFIEIKQDNKVAFEKLYNRYNKLVYGVAFCILKNEQDTEDIVQIVFTKIYSIDKSKLPNNNEASWLYSVTKNETINFLKKKNNNVNLDSIYEIEDTNNEITKIIDKDSYNRLISKLNDEEKEIISLKILSNLSFEEIGKVLNVPTGTIKWRYYKSIHTLKILLSNLGMFVVSFISSIVAFKNGSKLEQDTIEQENTNIEDNIVNEDEEMKGSLLEDKIENSVVEENQTTNNIIETPNTSNNTNYIGLGFMGISAIFFIVTIIFSIIFTKHQLKRRKKLSK